MNALVQFGRSMVAAPANLLVAAIRLYQRTVSPALPVITLGACGCRFTPTCSHYAIDAIRVHGAVRGMGLAAIRLVKCAPLHPGGIDPVPPKGHKTRPGCTRVGRSCDGRSSRSPVVPPSDPLQVS